MFAKKYSLRGEALNLIRFVENIRTDLTKSITQTYFLDFWFKE